MSLRRISIAKSGGATASRFGDRHVVDHPAGIDDRAGHAHRAETRDLGRRAAFENDLQPVTDDAGPVVVRLGQRGPDGIDGPVLDDGHERAGRDCGAAGGDTEGGEQDQGGGQAHQLPVSWHRSS